MQPQVHNQGLSLPTLLPTNQTQTYQLLLNRNLRSTISSTGVQTSASLPSSLTSVSGMNQTPINVVGQNASMQNNLSNVAQNPSSLVQRQNVIDQQLYQSQGVLSETSSNSTVQTDETNGVDWQEEIYQKIKTIKDIYLPELNEMRQKIDAKLQEHDSLPQQPKTDQLEKLKMFKIMADRMISFLQVSKDNVKISFKDKLSSYERQIITFLNTNRTRKPMPPMQQGQLPSSHMQSLQQPSSQITQAQFHENQMIPMTMHGSVSAMQQNNNMMNSMQTDSMASLQQGAMGSLQQNPISSPPASLSSVPSQNGLTTLQTSLPLQTNPNNMLQYQHQLQPYQQIQKQLMQQGMLQQQQWLKQCSQLLTLHQKARQQQEMLQLHQVAGVNEVKPNISSIPNVNAFAAPSIGQAPQESLAIGTTRVVVPDYGARGNDALATGKSTVAEQQSPDGAQLTQLISEARSPSAST
ncbi:unnamed protein product [Linum trigynum]|uniref:Mediator complex subunit 15 KIX domain-containing protein n=1 Tax=Linum trigynum TaxID=586398 RepID=A0AAV2F4D7_9ROSI